MERVTKHTHRERQRQWMAGLILAIYGLLIFEGVLRKWVFPEWGRWLFFVRDPLVILVYALALSQRMTPRKSVFLMAGLLLAAMSVPLIALQYSFAPSGFNWLLAAYGWRNYFLYLPLAFFVARYFELADAERLIRWTLWVSAPIAVLVYLQFLSPASAPINQGLGTRDDLLYRNGGVAFDVVRTYGTFTSSPGQNAFIASCVAMMLALWMLPKAQRRVHLVELVGATLAILTCLALCGSRGAVIWSALVSLAAVPAALAAGRRLAGRILVVPMAIGLAAILIVPKAFPLAVAAFVERWEGAYEAETAMYGPGGVFARAAFDLFSFRFLLADTPIQGYQMGIGGNAADLLGVRAERVQASDQQIGGAESDWGRQILELGPVLGICFIVFRVSLAIWTGVEALRATRRSRHPLPVFLFAFVAVLLFHGQMTGHGSLNGYTWLFAGLSMAVNRSLLRPQRRFEMYRAVRVRNIEACA